MQKITLYSEVKRTEVEWLWHPYIPLGKITLIQGDPGEGKTSLALKIASIVSSGGTMPDGRLLYEKATVMYQCAEDGLSDTVRPRLETNGAVLENTLFMGDEQNLIRTLEEPELTECIVNRNIRMLILDPVQSFLGKDNRVYDSCKIRSFMEMLTRIANNTQCSIILIGHLNKNESGKDLYRGLGSIDFVAAARSVLYVERLEDEPDIRVIRHIKSSLAPEGGAFAFTIDQHGSVNWLGRFDKKPDVQGRNASHDNKSEMIRHKLSLWLRDEDVPYSVILERTQNENISERTLKTAKKDLEIQSIKKGDHWYWHLEKDGGSNES